MTTFFSPFRIQPSAFGNGAGRDVEHVVARLALAQRAGEFQFAAGDLLQQGALAACQAQEFGAQHGGEIGFDDQAAAQFLHHDEHVDRVAVEAAVFLGHRQRRHAQFGQRGPGGIGGAAARNG